MMLFYSDWFLYEHCRKLITCPKGPMKCLMENKFTYNHSPYSFKFISWNFFIQHESYRLRKNYILSPLSSVLYHILSPFLQCHILKIEIFTWCISNLTLTYSTSYRAYPRLDMFFIINHRKNNLWSRFVYAQHGRFWKYGLGFVLGLKRLLYIFYVFVYFYKKIALLIIRFHTSDY